MKVTLKLFASLSEFLPAGSTNHQTNVDVEYDTTPHQLIDRYRVPRKMAHLVVLNGVYLHPKERDQPVMKEGDALAIWPPVAGG
jgi:sulfur-carrier protein